MPPSSSNVKPEALNAQELADLGDVGLPQFEALERDLVNRGIDDVAEELTRAFGGGGVITPADLLNPLNGGGAHSGDTPLGGAQVRSGVVSRLWGANRKKIIAQRRDHLGT